MSKIRKTSGIVLNVQRLGETSKLVTIFTKDYGKLLFLAKGARKLKSQFSGALETFTHCEVIFYYSERKTIYTLSSADIIENFLSLKSVTKFVTAHKLIEVVMRSTKLEDPIQALYYLLHSALKTLNELKNPPKKHLRSFLGAYYLKAISLLGYRPELNCCVRCRSSKINYFSISLGGGICDPQKHPEVKDLSPKVHIKPMKFLLSHELAKSIRLQISDETFNLINHYCEYYLETQPQEEINLQLPFGEKN
ncbi:MAG: DNA repair protein RecO [candidate division WOR-3 bacterium]|nr:DNA repair protein RecO [candidate division WOR-3 bacterium]MCX7756696.1 DNA repair protein RecO [candidate division WOR-3 bacterium]MDW7987871.1 DNA repair protein RecO [candidate division WOR-3 bacterium]